MSLMRAASVALALVWASTSAHAAPLGFDCFRLDVEIRFDTGATQPALAEAHGCPGPLSAEVPPGLDGSASALVSASDGVIRHEQIYAPELGSVARYYRSVATVSFTLDQAAPVLHIVPDLPPIGDGASWNMRLAIANEVTDEQQWFFIGTPITAFDQGYLSDPQVEELFVNLTPGDTYTVRSIVQLFANQLEDQQNAVTLSLFAVPEPASVLTLGAALVALASIKPKGR